MAIAFVGAWPGSVNQITSGTTNAMTGRVPAAGELIVGMVAASTLFTGVTDASGQTYTVLGPYGPIVGGFKGASVWVYYLPNATNVSHAPTANFSSASYSSHICGSFTGVATGTPYDAGCTISALGNSSSLASGSMPQSTTFANEVVIGYGIMDFNSASCTWSAQQISGVGAGGMGNAAAGNNTPAIIGAFKVESVSAAYNFTVTNAQSGNWLALILSFADTNITSGISVAWIT